MFVPFVPRILSLSCRISLSRFFSALFLRVPHRGCTGFYLPNRPNILQLLCSMLKLHDRFSFCLPGIDQRFRLVPATLRLSYCPALRWALCAPFIPSMSLLAELDPFVKPHQPCIIISAFGSSYDMYQICTRYLRALSPPCPSRLLLSVRVFILTEYENLHVFEDCVGRRVRTLQGRFWSLLQVQDALVMHSTLIYSI